LTDRHEADAGIRVDFDGNVTDNVTGDDGAGNVDGPTELDGIGESVDPAIGMRMRSGLRWSLLSTVLSRMVNPLTGIILARILSPRDFGIFAVALIALNGLNSINELGVTYAVVRWPGDLKVAARTATTIAIGASVLIFIACFIAAPFFASELHTPEATGVLRLLALGVVIDGIASVPIGLLTRGFRQDKRAIAEWSGFVVSTSVTVGLALTGFGAWSLAWGRLAGTSVNCGALYILAPERPRPGWDKAVARDLLRFGVPLTGSSFLVFAMLNVDYLVVGRELGTVALGYYALAFNLSSFPWNLLSTAVRPIAVPAFARFQHDNIRLREVFLRWFHLLMSATVPICTLLGVLALPLVTVVYGSKWRPAASALVFLAALGGLRVAIDFCYDLFVAVGESRALVYIQGLWLVALVPALTIGARHDGIQGVGIAHVVVAAGIIAPVYLFALRRRHGLRPLAVIGAVARPLVGGFFAAAAGVAVMSRFSTDIGELAAGGIAILVVYGIVGISVRELRSLPRMLSRRGGGIDGDTAAAA
jgi:O-antigen/teichoic acid export membrane protein